LVGLLVVASPATALRRGKARETHGGDCADDPEFLYKKRPKKNSGIIRDCAWIGSLRNKKKRKKICDSTKKGTGKEVKESCPVACDDCPPVQESCPSIQPNKGDDCNLQDGTKLCNYDYAITGCTGAIEEAKCVAQSVYSCRGGSWTDSTIDDPGCGNGLGSPFVGDSCDPKKYCSAEPPLHGAPCEDDQAELACAYDYVDISCDEDVEDCRPIIEAFCETSGSWTVEQRTLSCTDEIYPPNWGHECDPTMAGLII